MPLNSRKVLIIDDEPDIRETIEEALALNGFPAFGVGSVNEALEVLERGERPALVLLDLMMPCEGGGAFLREWARNPDLRELPVIVISADGHMEEKIEGFEVQGHLRKPIPLGKLLQVAEQYCGQG